MAYDGGNLEKIADTSYAHPIALQGLQHAHEVILGRIVDFDFRPGIPLEDGDHRISFAGVMGKARP